MIATLGASSASRCNGPGAVSTPIVTATTRSAIRSAFHRIAALRAFGEPRLTREATNGAVSPIATSPIPAGSANAPGNAPRIHSARNTTPAARYSCNPIIQCSGISLTTLRAEGIVRNARYAIASGMIEYAIRGTRSAGPREKNPRAESVNARRSQSPMKTALGTMSSRAELRANRRKTSHASTGTVIDAEVTRSRIQRGIEGCMVLSSVDG